MDSLSFLVDHSGSNVKIAFGYRIDFAGRSVVLSGDTGFSETLIKNAQGADLLVHEVAAYSEELKQRRPRYKRIEERHTSILFFTSFAQLARGKQTIICPVD